MSSPSTLDDGAPVKNEVLHADFKFEDVKPGMLFWLYTADKISSRLRLKWGLHAKAMGHPFLILDKRVVAGTDTVCGCIVGVPISEITKTDNDKVHIHLHPWPRSR